MLSSTGVSQPPSGQGSVLVNAILIKRGAPLCVARAHVTGFIANKSLAAAVVAGGGFRSIGPAPFVSTAAKVNKAPGMAPPAPRDWQAFWRLWL